MQADVSNPQWSFGSDGARISFLVSSAEAARRICDSFKTGQIYEMVVRKKRKKRSLDANALMWAVIGEIADELRKTDPKIHPEQLYRKYVGETGNYVVSEIWEDDYDRLRQTWASNGIAWFIRIADI